MKVLCFDIASGGLTSATFNERLKSDKVVETSWEITQSKDGAAVLDVATFDAAIAKAFASLPQTERVDAISFSAFMHNCLLLDARENPITPIYTWMDRRGVEGVEYIRAQFGERFHQRTGCRFHPMFPVFKVAALRAAADPLLTSVRRIVTAKSLLIARLTGIWAEDHGTASATGMYDVTRGCWDDELVAMLGLDAKMLPPLVRREAVVGTTMPDAATRYGSPNGIPVVAGSGDGFLANIGSGCETPERMAITLGTSGSVRQMLPSVVLDDAAGTFCYRADHDQFLLGCASSNGGNVLDWARSVFGRLPDSPSRDAPTFLPLLHGERSPDWNPLLTAQWSGVTALHTAPDLASAVVDGVVFNLAHYADILKTASRQKASQIILSGNGFLNRVAAETLATVLDVEVRLPKAHGLGSLRGAAICGLRALGVDTSGASDQLIEQADIVSGLPDTGIDGRYRRYRELRNRAGAVLPSGA